MPVNTATPRYIIPNPYKASNNENGISKNKNIPCQYILKRGKNKGKQCNKKCFLGYEYCKIHKKSLKLE